MNIIFITNTFTPHVGGVARSIEAFSEQLRERGHRVLVIAPEFPDAPEEELVLGGLGHAETSALARGLGRLASREIGPVTSPRWDEAWSRPDERPMCLTRGRKPLPKALEASSACRSVAR